MVDKFRSVAHFIQGELIWVSLKEHPLSVQKHVVTSSSCLSRYGNILPPPEVTQGTPVKVKIFEELGIAPTTHRFIGQKWPFKPEVMDLFVEMYDNEILNLIASPPPGMWVRTFTDRPVNEWAPMPIKYLDLRNFQIKSKPNPTQPYLI
jgi:hypothetical protein